MAKSEISLRSKLLQCYKNKSLCDVALVAVADGTRIEAHRLVLFVATEYFDILLTIPMKERDMYEIELKEIDGKTLQNFVEYCYTGQIDVNAGNVTEVLAAATMYRFVDVLQQCFEVYAQIMDPTNCLSICAIADQYKLENIHKEATHFLNEYLTDVMKTDEFLQLKVEEILKFVKSEEIAVDSEDDILIGITKWTEFDIDGRKGFFKDLISNVKLNLDKAYTPYLVNLGENVELVVDFLSVFKQQMNGEQVPNMNRQSPLAGKLLAIGGDAGENLSIERYCPRLDSWKAVETYFSYRRYFAVARLNNNIYIIGGNLNGSTTNEVYCMSMKTMESSQLAPLNKKRSSLAVAVFKDCIYAIGGYSRSDALYLQSVERFDAKLNQWTAVPSMVHGRFCHAAAVISGRIYVVGGYGNSGGLSSTERYDLDQNAWTTVAEMNVERRNHGCCVVNGFLYAVGGCDGQDVPLDSMERYDETIDRWTMVETRLEIPCNAFGIAVCGDWVYIAGGHIARDGKGTSRNEFEKVNFVTGERAKLTPMQQKRSSFHLCYGK